MLGYRRSSLAGESSSDMTVPDAQIEISNGACLCGAVRFSIRGALRPIVFCHCGQCRRVQGQFAANTAAPRESIELSHDVALKWFDSSSHARRGFCGICGSTLFWVAADETYWAIAAGALDASSDLTPLHHVFAADKARYYDILDDLPQLPGSQREADR